MQDNALKLVLTMLTGLSVVRAIEVGLVDRLLDVQVERQHAEHVCPRRDLPPSPPCAGAAFAHAPRTELPPVHSR